MGGSFKWKMWDGQVAQGTDLGKWGLYQALVRGSSGAWRSSRQSQGPLIRNLLGLSVPASSLNSFPWFNLTHDLLFRYQSYRKNISFCRKNWMKWFCHGNWSLFIWVSILISQLIDELPRGSASQVKISGFRTPCRKGSARYFPLFVYYLPTFILWRIWGDRFLTVLGRAFVSFHFL